MKIVARPDMGTILGRFGCGNWLIGAMEQLQGCQNLEYKYLRKYEAVAHRYL